MHDEAILTLNQVNVGYLQRFRPPITVLSGISEAIHPGFLVGLVGPNGAGKSTLLRSIAGLQPLLSGTVLLKNESISAMRRRQVAQRMAVVLTDRVEAGRLRVVDVVRLGRYPHTGIGGHLDASDEAKVSRAIDTVGANALRNADFSELSDGQRQRVMVARALAQEPEILLLDEPTAFLDPPGRVSLLELLRDVAQKERIAVLVCSHDIESLLGYADTLWVAGPGASVVSGGPEDLAAAGQLESAFRTTGVSFDLHTLGFKATNPDAPWSRVDGIGDTAELASHALQRAGWQVDEYDQHTPKIIVDAQDRLQIVCPVPEQIANFEDLYTRCRELRRQLSRS